MTYKDPVMLSIQEPSITEKLIARIEREARNEMHSAMGMLELVAEGPLTDAQFEYLTACRSSADRFLRYIQNVHQFFFPEARKPQPSQIDLRETVAGVTNLMGSLAQRRGLSLTTEIPPDMPTRMTGDRGG